MKPASDPAGGACPCGRTGDRGLLRAYPDCCGRYLDAFETLPAPDAESLMRSRYTAFVRERADYLRATWDAAHRPAAIGFEPGLRWLGLELRSHRMTGPDTAEVEFVARSRLAGRAHRLHERSRFVRRGGRWFYLDGEDPGA
jgi:SEC-C motif-containing protein